MVLHVDVHVFFVDWNQVTIAPGPMSPNSSCSTSFFVSLRLNIESYVDKTYLKYAYDKPVLLIFNTSIQGVNLCSIA